MISPGTAALGDDGSLYQGQRGSYGWLSVTAGMHIGTLLSVCPDLVLNRYIAVVAYDSGTRRLTDDELSRGWYESDGILYSPRLNSTSGLRYSDDGPDLVGYDEWYMFADRQRLSPVCTGGYFEPEVAARTTIRFVNILAFALHDPDSSAINDLFWKQLEVISPEAYIADGHQSLTVVSRDHNKIQSIGESLLNRY